MKYGEILYYVSCLVVDLMMIKAGQTGKLPTYPSPKPTLTLTSHLAREKCWLRGGVGGQFPSNVE